MNKTIEELNRILTSPGAVQMQIQEYRSTHGYLAIVLTDGDNRQCGLLYMSDCSYICGPTSGGPFSWSITSEPGERCEELVIRGGELMARALRVGFAYPGEYGSRPGLA
jgi:hypothetical protein